MGSQVAIRVGGLSLLNFEHIALYTAMKQEFDSPGPHNWTEPETKQKQLYPLCTHSLQGRRIEPGTGISHQSFIIHDMVACVSHLPCLDALVDNLGLPTDLKYSCGDQFDLLSNLAFKNCPNVKIVA